VAAAARLDFEFCKEDGRVFTRFSFYFDENGWHYRETIEDL